MAAIIADAIFLKIGILIPFDRDAAAVFLNRMRFKGENMQQFKVLRRPLRV
ncbi:hypothetical protein [Ensifer sp. R-19]|uniref:hypothetical protein n=1 Tax=unclassified Ensifer TaxID=2633371 RepID=UPI0013AF9E99